ncbi:CAP domain-containing protein [Shouchella sp. JSM 1781072]|uniref:CAP domain-containing protein n=1 Tax=Bacillaceae TaxID=186817 RepID=UPI0020D07CAB|nr:CAP domain-containing protein [Alkalihalobacillus sp. LMS6]UTR04879.1 CAP domain-containing protein [Alkalihalobacillus sp. LMS6]
MYKRLGLLSVLLVILFILINEYRQLPSEAVVGYELSTKQPSLHMDYTSRAIPSFLEQDEMNPDAERNEAVPFSSNIGSLMGLNTEEIVDALGDPKRIDPSAFGYESWIYNNVEAGYLTIGVKDDQAATVVAQGSPIHAFLGEGELSFEALNRMFLFNETVPLETETGLFTFQLSEQDLQMRPIAQVGDYYIQFYMDIHTNTLASVRLMTDEVLLNQRPYSFRYTNDLPEKVSLSQSDMEKIDEANEKQIFELTNAIRTSYGLKPFTWSDDVAQVAYNHSKDMHDEEYFDHVSPIHGTLLDRFHAGHVSFAEAGENIAFNYVDGIAAVGGWLNSDSHRVVLLHEEFTDLGVGVHDSYYTQNFSVE